MKENLIIIVCLVLLICAILISVCIGSVTLSPIDVVSVLSGNTEYPQYVQLRTIILNLRIPRIIIAALAGWALGLSGAAFQGIFRNPLADPYIIGASSGASLGATLAIIFGFQIFSNFSLTLSAFAGAVGTVSLVFILARGKGSNPPVISLLLAGTAVSSFISSLVTLLMIWHSEDIHTIFYWLLGSFTTVSWNEIITIIFFLLLGTITLHSIGKGLDILSFGEETASNMGISVIHIRYITVISATLLTAATVSICGIIAFAGLIAPHFGRLLIGPRHRRLFVLSGGIGALLLVVSDIAARTILYPVEIPVGVITAMLGAPFFLYLLYKRSRGNAI